MRRLKIKPEFFPEGTADGEDCWYRVLHSLKDSRGELWHVIEVTQDHKSGPMGLHCVADHSGIIVDREE